MWICVEIYRQLNQQQGHLRPCALARSHTIRAKVAVLQAVGRMIEVALMENQLVLSSCTGSELLAVHMRRVRAGLFPELPA